MSEITTVAVLGTGLMGAPMARRLLQAGFEVRAWNRTGAKAEALAGEGAAAFDTPAAAVTDADMAVAMLENGPVVEEVLFELGTAEAMAEGAILADMSSIPPSLARDHAARLAQRGVAHLDAPVSGGTVGAEAGTLAIMAGGETQAFARAAPVFAAMGRATHVGPAGAGQLAKLANQAIVGITIGAVAEALLLAAAGGANPAAVREAIRGGFAESRILEVHGQRMIDRDFAPRGLSRTQLKDMNTIVETACELGLDLPLSSNVRGRYERLVGELARGGTDHSALLLELEAANLPHRVGVEEDVLS